MQSNSLASLGSGYSLQWESMFNTHNQPSRLLSRCPQIMGQCCSGPWVPGWCGEDTWKRQWARKQLWTVRRCLAITTVLASLVRVDAAWALPSHVNLHTSRVRGRCCHRLFYSNSGFKPVSYELRSHGPVLCAQARGEGHAASSSSTARKVPAPEW